MSIQSEARARFRRYILSDTYPKIRIAGRTVKCAVCKKRNARKLLDRGALCKNCAARWAYIDMCLGAFDGNGMFMPFIRVM